MLVGNKSLLCQTYSEHGDITVLMQVVDFHCLNCLQDGFRKVGGREDSRPLEPVARVEVGL